MRWEELTFSTSCCRSTSPEPKILEDEVLTGAASSEAVYLGAGSMLLRPAAMEVILMVFFFLDMEATDDVRATRKMFELAACQDWAPCGWLMTNLVADCF
jgi:hypothetical protein